MSELCRRRDRCRACGGNGLRQFLSLGPTPLANAFLRSRAEFAHEASYPLDVYFCTACSLVQLLDVIDPAVLFRDYPYVSGTSETIRQHNAALAAELVRELGLRPGDLVVEVASNDGSLLACFAAYGVRTLGVEPAANIAALARAAGIRTIEAFFDATCAHEIRAGHGAARAVVANNVLAHVDDTAGFLTACREVLDREAALVVEVPYLSDLLDHLEYDTIYHEHLCYFSMTALLRLAEAAGLSVVRVDRVPIHGGSLRLWAMRREDAPQHGTDTVKLAEEERRRGLTGYGPYERFGRQVEANRAALVGLLEELVRSGERVAGYGAPAKGNTLLNYCGIGPRLLPYTVDRNPLKVGTYTPGTHIPVLPVEVIGRRKPGYLLILAWNFADEIIGQQAAFREGGGRFILPIPEPRVV